ncbi:protein of unknown function [Candidatus Nitrosocosmicus franklandus]|uniref:Uncharacterized protein n=1 Tax=Candidatus Nitrosocosmicus franklandianus TaxID=1798806 RepID=A0A484IHJ6_9ARCH|nr:protein of unknown function [Candidatus Nitrosocosmicus franklandus]VFJ15125.1 protein of unknown function [Candidatus Nitrosocosmicus franklandus]
MELDSKVRASKAKSTRRRVLEYIIDETMLNVGSEFVWLWVATEPDRKQANSRTVYL